MITNAIRTIIGHKANFWAALPLIAITGLLHCPQGMAQSSPDYHPGEAIKFHDLSGASTSVPSSTSSAPSSSSSSSLTVPEKSAAVKSDKDAAGAASEPSTANGTDGNQSAHDPNEKGLGSFFKNVVRQELQSGNFHRGNYSNSNQSNGYGNPPQSYGNFQQQGQPYGSQMQNPHRPGTYTYTRPDAVQENSYSQNQNQSNSNRPDSQQSGPRIGSNVMEFVSSNPPISMTGDIENLFPKELHAKAYGKELGRNGPMNGAEDEDHLY